MTKRRNEQTLCCVCRLAPAILADGGMLTLSSFRCGACDSSWCLSARFFSSAMRSAMRLLWTRRCCSSSLPSSSETVSCSGCTLCRVLFWMASSFCTFCNALAASAFKASFSAIHVVRSCSKPSDTSLNFCACSAAFATPSCSDTSNADLSSSICTAPSSMLSQACFSLSLSVATSSRSASCSALAILSASMASSMRACMTFSRWLVSER
mmetsp:Transcript_6930/g.25539  ORF Transcript_6930/g.25539 Transcript_6930/m.25539 type:complete len:210 (-) Transcript_6930:764-1393(-)